MGVEPLSENKKRKRILILFADDWEGLYVDGKLIEEEHSLGESDILFLLKLSEELGFTSDDITLKNIIEDDERELVQVGSFPQKLSELKGIY